MRLKKVCRISAPLNPLCINPQMISSRGYNMWRSAQATPYSQLGWGMGRPPVNTGGSASMSFHYKNHALRHLIKGSGIRMEN
jgi:hypothetical protein